MMMNRWRLTTVALAALAMVACDDDSEESGGNGGEGGRVQVDAGMGGAGGTPVGGAMGGMPMGGEPVGGEPVGGMPVGGEPVGGEPLGGEPVGGGPVGGEPMGGEPMGGEPMGGEPMGGMPMGGDPMGGMPMGGDPMGGMPMGGEPVMFDCEVLCAAASACATEIPEGEEAPLCPDLEDGATATAACLAACNETPDDFAEIPADDCVGLISAVAIADGEFAGQCIADLVVECPAEIPAFEGVAQEDGSLRLVGSNVEAGANHVGTCGGNGAEVLYSFTAPEAGLWRFSTVDEGTSYDTVLYARATCGEVLSELACNDDTDGLQSVIQVELEANESITLFADAYGEDSVGDFALTARFVPQIAAGEVCDPDGVLNTCVEGTFCEAADPEQPAVCTAAQAPAIAGGTANLEGPVLRLRVDGSDANADVFNLGLQLLDAEGTPLDLVGDPEAEPLLEGFLDVSAQVEGQDEFTIRLAIELNPALAGVATTARVRLQDDRGLFSDPFDIALADRAVVDLNGECDTTEVENVCAEGAFCFAAPGEDGVIPQVGACTNATPPVLNSLQAFENLDLLVLIAEGTDASRDVVGVRLTLVDEQGADVTFVDPETEELLPATFDFAPPEPVYGEENVRVVISATGLGQFPETASVRVSLLDSTDLVSEPITVELLPQPTVADGEACDPDGILNTCEGQSRCVAEGEAAPVCVAPVAPVLQMGTAYFNPNTNALGLSMMGTSATALSGFEYNLIDVEGNIIPVNDSEEPLFAFGFDTLEQPEDGDAFTATSTRFLPAGIEGIAAVRVTLFDEEDIQSEPVDLNVAEPPLLEAGAECDVAGAFNRCPEGQICVNGEPATCQAPVAECPEGWPVENLNDRLGVNGAWVVDDGSTVGAESLTAGTCGGGSGQDVYSFVAPRDGLFRFETSAVEENADTVLYVRDLCGIDSPEAELACNDDSEPGVLQSALELQLVADQEVFVFVDGFFDGFFGEGWQGAYILTVSEVVPE